MITGFKRGTTSLVLVLVSVLVLVVGLTTLRVFARSEAKIRKDVEVGGSGGREQNERRREGSNRGGQERERRERRRE